MCTKIMTIHTILQVLRLLREGSRKWFADRLTAILNKNIEH
jgi:hypothetical protein